MEQTSEARIIYISRSDATPETELSALVNIYKLLLDSAKKNAAGVTSANGGDAKKGSLKHEVRARISIHE